jgi:hypothetical protein
MTTAERTKRLEPLGYTRLRILGCLWGDVPSFPQYLELAPGDDVFRAFEAFVQRMIQLSAESDEPPTRALIGAARLLVGDVAGAHEVLDHLPATPVRLDQGAGYCMLVPTLAMLAALPLPENLRDRARWLAGSSEEADLRAWLGQHHGRLVWDEAAGRYSIAKDDTTPGE